MRATAASIRNAAFLVQRKRIAADVQDSEEKASQTSYLTHWAAIRREEILSEKSKKNMRVSVRI
jgi:hypothetical protein